MCCPRVYTLSLSHLPQKKCPRYSFSSPHPSSHSGPLSLLVSFHPAALLPPPPKKTPSPRPAALPKSLLHILPDLQPSRLGLSEAGPLQGDACELGRHPPPRPMPSTCSPGRGPAPTPERLRDSERPPQPLCAQGHLRRADTLLPPCLPPRTLAGDTGNPLPTLLPSPSSAPPAPGPQGPRAPFHQPQLTQPRLQAPGPSRHLCSTGNPTQPRAPGSQGVLLGNRSLHDKSSPAVLWKAVSGPVPAFRTHMPAPGTHRPGVDGRDLERGDRARARERPRTIPALGPTHSLEAQRTRSPWSLCSPPGTSGQGDQRALQPAPPQAIFRSRQRTGGTREFPLHNCPGGFQGRCLGKII